MMILKLYNLKFIRQITCSVSRLCSQVKFENVHTLCRYFNIDETKAHYICLKYPVIRKLNDCELTALITTFKNLGYPKEDLLNEPNIFSLLPITLKYRYDVLKECGIYRILPSHLASYLNFVKRKTIGELKKTGEIFPYINVENRLATFLTQWPTSLTTTIYGDINNFTLLDIRLKILHRYLELVLDLTEDEFARGIETYPTIKHRPLKIINKILTILQAEIKMQNNKIKSNLYLLQSDPENLKKIIYNFQTIGGIDVKEVLRAVPRIALRNYSLLVEMKQVLDEFKISNEAQQRCLEIYTLGPNTVRERLVNALKTPDLQIFFGHPRFLRMILFNKTAMKRLKNLYDNNKKCVSLSILSGCKARYEIFKQTPGDRSGKVKDLVFCISQALENSYSKSSIRSQICRHPFLLNIPLVQVKFVHKELTFKKFTNSEIYDNLPILLYPWNKIRDTLQMFNKKKKGCEILTPYEQLNFNLLSNSEKLSLVLYILEKDHYFSGNGVWTQEKIRNLSEVGHNINELNTLKQVQSNLS